MRTTLALGLVSSNPSNLLSTSLCDDGRQAWTALAEIARQLQVLARAQTGEGISFAHSLSSSALPPFLTVSQLVELTLAGKEKAARDEKYIRQLGYTLRHFARYNGKKMIHEVCHADVEGWLEKLDVGDRRQITYRDDVRMMFNLAIKRGLLEKSPLAAIELPDKQEGEIVIHHPATVKRVMDFAHDYDLGICRALACRYFGGLRTVETERASEENICEGHIDVTKKVSKQGRARKRRIVTIQPNLAEWLKLGGELPAPPQNGRKMLEFQRALLADGIDWPQNVARHSYCSYHLAKFRSAADTALESGHTETMLFENYRALKTPCGKLVTQKLAEEYFSIAPG